MWKSLLLSTVVLAMAGSGMAVAQSRPDGRPAPGAPQVSPPGAGPQQNPTAQQLSALDAAAVTDGRLATLRTRLALTPDQEKNWPAFEQAYRDYARLRAERWRDLRGQQRSDNPVENFQAWADFANRRTSGMKRLADAALPLYQSLDQSQQGRFVDQIYEWHPRLAWLGERGGARQGAGEGPERRGFGRGPGMGPHWGYRGGDDEDWRGYGPGRGPGMGRHWGFRGGDGEDGRGYGPGEGRGMGPHWGYRGGDDESYGPGRGPGMGPRWGFRGGDGQDWRGYGPGEGRGMGPHWGWHEGGSCWRGRGPGMGHWGRFGGSTDDWQPSDDRGEQTGGLGEDRR